MKDSIIPIENKSEEPFVSNNDDYSKAKEIHTENNTKEDKTEIDDNLNESGKEDSNNFKTKESIPIIPQLENQTSCDDSGYSSNISRNSTKDLDDCKTDAEMENLTGDSSNDDLDINVSVTNQRMCSTSRCDSALSKDSTIEKDKGSEGCNDFQSSSGTTSSGSEYEYESENDSDNQGLIL